MLNEKEFKKILEYFDSFLWDNKTTETSWNYYGIVLDYYFDESILSIDYLTLRDYFDTNGGYEIVDTETMEEQFINLDEGRRLKFIENVLNILCLTSLHSEMLQEKTKKIKSFLNRNNILFSTRKDGVIVIKDNNIINSGSYCNIIFITKGILKKELKKKYLSDEGIKKRFKYEFDIMQKMSDCPYILNVHDLDKVAYSFLMEEAEMNLYDYISDEVDLSVDIKLKIISDLLNGMKHAHDNSIIHRDLHLGNILKINNDFIICDFGLGKDESVIRSLVSSATVKNNHYFIDPTAVSDFTKLDKKSDIYAIGKIIDYVMNSGTSQSEHILSYVGEKCTRRVKDKRYDSIDEIIDDVNSIIKSKTDTSNKEINDKRISKGIYDIEIDKYIKGLMNNGDLSDYLVKHKNNNFGIIILEFDKHIQIDILSQINRNYVEATGFGGFRNYDIFTDISYYVINNSNDPKVIEIAKSILDGCANFRFKARDLLEKIKKDEL